MFRKIQVFTILYYKKYWLLRMSIRNEIHMLYLDNTDEYVIYAGVQIMWHPTIYILPCEVHFEIKYKVMFYFLVSYRGCCIIIECLEVIHDILGLLFIYFICKLMFILSSIYHHLLFILQKLNHKFIRTITLPDFEPVYDMTTFVKNILIYQVQYDSIYIFFDVF